MGNESLTSVDFRYPTIASSIWIPRQVRNDNAGRFRPGLQTCQRLNPQSTIPGCHTRQRSGIQMGNESLTSVDFRYQPIATSCWIPRQSRNDNVGCFRSG
ncbi:MAG TPA: hypothetical protein VJ991_08970 [Balneolales bacterium]|nr:hypothetical protein [Balneolales bacterium]